MNDAENVAKRVETPMHCMNQSRVEAGKRISPTNTAAAADAATACVEGREETAGSPYSLLTLPASLSSRREAERTSDDRGLSRCL